MRALPLFVLAAILINCAERCIKLAGCLASSHEGEEERE